MTGITLLQANQIADSLMYMKRARELISEGVEIRPTISVAIESYLSFESYLSGDLETTLKEYDRFAQTAASRTGTGRDNFCNLVVSNYERLGKLKTAEEFARNVTTEAWNRLYPADYSYWRGFRDFVMVELTGNVNTSLSKHLPALVERSDTKEFLAPFLTRAGLISQAHRMMQSWKGPKNVSSILEGEIALAKGQREQAISLLQTAVDSLRSESHPLALFVGWDSLATAYEQQGDSANLLRLLEEATKENEYRIPEMLFWLKLKLRRAQLYRQMERVEDAQKIETELSRLLAYADEDHPILVQLRRAQGK